MGFESLNAGNLSDARKRAPAPEDYARRVEVLHRSGIQVNGSFVLSFDHDRPDVFERTVEWIEANRLECATFHILPAYPGTSLFRQLEAEGRILHPDWDSYDTAHLETPACRPQRRACLSRDELSVQTLESLLALADPTLSYGSRVATVDRALTTSPYEASSASRSSGSDERCHRRYRQSEPLCQPGRLGLISVNCDLAPNFRSMND